MVFFHRNSLHGQSPDIHIHLDDTSVNGSTPNRQINDNSRAEQFSVHQESIQSIKNLHYAPCKIACLCLEFSNLLLPKFTTFFDQGFTYIVTFLLLHLPQNSIKLKWTILPVYYKIMFSEHYGS